MFLCAHSRLLDKQTQCSTEVLINSLIFIHRTKDELESCRNGRQSPTSTLQEHSRETVIYSRYVLLLKVLPNDWSPWNGNILGFWQMGWRKRVLRALTSESEKAGMGILKF